MKRLFLVACGLVSLSAAAADPVPRTAMPSAAEIVSRNEAARGGLEAWRKIRTLVRAGHIESANAPVAAMPFVLEEMRPNKSRFEITVMGKRSVRLYDGSHGWKVLSGGSGQPELQPYTPQELKFAHDAQVIDGPLMDTAARGDTVTLEGADAVEGKPAWRLNVKQSSGESHRVWVDAATFLDLKSEREARNAAGMAGTITLSYRDYRPVEGLQMPYLIETGGSGGKEPDKMVIERIVLNPPLGERAFAKPHLPGSHRNVVTITADTPSDTGLPAWAQAPGRNPAMAPVPGMNRAQ